MRMLATLLAGVRGSGGGRGGGAGQCAGQVPDAVLGRLGPGKRAGGAEQGLHQADRHRDEVRVRAVAELRRPDAERAELEGSAVRPADRRQPVDRRLGDQRPLRQAQRFLRQGRNQDERFPAMPRSTPTRLGPRARRTIGRCRPWATRWAGSTARTGSPGPSCRPSSSRSTAATWRRPTTWTELKQVAEFFQGREIDGKKVYGAAIFTERGSEGITMGVTAALYAWGFQYENPSKPYDMEGFVNSQGGGRGARVLQVALQVLHAAGLHRHLHAGGPGRLQVGPGRDA